MYQGNIRKMRVELTEPVQYALLVGVDLVALNERIGKPIHLAYSGQIHCVACGRKTSKSFNQGYCFPCMRSLAECDVCIVRPEQCHFHEGTCRDAEWALHHCMQSHVVYLANSSGLKVGITRGSQIPTRWIDQGATQALPLFRVANRYISGLLEVVLKQHVSDRTDWRRMLKADADPVNLFAEGQRIIERCRAEIDALNLRFGAVAIELLEMPEPTNIQYPVQRYPDKVTALNLDKTPVVDGVLEGIKGQYLLLDSGVINMRKYAGYELALDFPN